MCSGRRGPLVFFVIVLASGFLYLLIISRQGSGVVSNLIFDSKRPSALKVVSTDHELEAILTDQYISLFRSDPLCKNTDRNPFRGNDNLLVRLMQALREYAEWHRKERNNLLSKDPEKVRNIRTLIWHFKEYPKSPGLADKVRGLSAALILSIMSERLLFIQWSSQPFRTSRQRSIFEPNHINWDIDEDILTIIGKRFTIDKPDFGVFIPKKCFEGRCKENVPIINKMIANVFSCGEVDQHLFFGNTRFFKGVSNYIVNYSGASSNCTLYHKIHLIDDFIKAFKVLKVNGKDMSDSIYGRFLFKFSDSILNRASHELQKIGIQVDQKYSVCHIRTGFFGLYNETLFGKKVTRAETWKKLVDGTIANSRKSFGANAPVLVMTDSVLVKQWVRREYKNGSVKVTEGAVGHIGMRGNLTDKDIEEVEYQTGTELSIMAHSNLLTTSVGGFGFLARKLCLIRLK